MFKMSFLEKKQWKKWKAKILRVWLLSIKALLKGYVLLICILALFLIVYSIPGKIPISAIAENSQTVISFLSLIVGALASIMGIIVAILLVAFELFRRRYATYAFKEFFQDKYLRNLFILYVSTILISIFALARLEDPVTTQNVNLSYLSILLFFACIIALYPCAKKILGSTMSKNKIREIVDRITYQSIDSFGHFRRHVPAEHYVSVIEENPLFVLSEAAIRTINEGDRLTPRLILVESGEKLKQFINEDCHDKRNIINAFLIIFRHSAKQAILQKQEGTLTTALDVMREIHVFCAEKKVAWHEVIEFNELLQEILLDTIGADLDEIARKGMWDVKFILKKHLEKNVPAENEIWMLRDLKDKEDIGAVDHDKSLQWENVSHAYINMLSQLTEKGIELKKGQFLFSALRCFTDIASEVVDTKLGDKQKVAIISWCCYCAKSLTVKCADKGLYRDVLILTPFNFFGIKKMLDKNTEYSKRPLLDFCETLIELAQRDVFDTFAFNELGATGRGAIEEIDKSLLHKEALVLICKTFDRIREAIEKSNRPEKEKAYPEAFRQVQSLKRWMESKGKHDKAVEDEIESVLGKFKELEKYEGDIIKWPRMTDNNSSEKASPDASETD